MKKYINIAMYYAIAALASGVFYREFTKFNDFTGVTALGKVHTHLFVLGMFMFLIVALFVKNSTLEKIKSFKLFLYVYNVGVILASVMMTIRGSLQVLGTELSKGLSAAISGISGLGHIFIAIGIVLLFNTLRKL